MKSFLKSICDLFGEEDGGLDESRRYNVTAQLGNFVLNSVGHVFVHSKYSKQNRKYIACWHSLTMREQEVLALVCMAYKNFEIARFLFIGDATVKTHLQSIFDKFGLRDRHDLRLALRDWDFQTWWQHRHRRPVPLPPIGTRG